MSLKRLGTAASWLYAEQAVGLIIQFSIGVWMIRSFVPDDYGRWGLLAAVLYVTSALSRLGLDDLLVRNMVRDPAAARDWLGRGLTLRLFSAPVMAAATVGSIAFLRSGDPVIIGMAWAGALALLLRQGEIGEAYLRATLRMRQLATARVSALVVGAAIKAGLLLAHAPIEAFAYAIIADYGLVGLLMIVTCWRAGMPLKFAALGDRALGPLMRETLPVWASFAAVVVYQKLDVVFVGASLDNAAVGVYSAAARISEALYYVPFVLLQTVTPMLITSRRRSRRLYDVRFRQVVQVVVLVMLIAALTLTAIGRPLIGFLFGEQYAAAGDILRVHAWTGVVSGLGYASTVWLISEGRTSAVLIRTVAGAVLSLAFMAILTPRFGALGAAGGVLIAQLIAVTAVIWAIPGRSRLHARALTRALTLRDLTLLTPTRLAQPVLMRQVAGSSSDGLGTNGGASG
jgi:PST family polysaccharide transporter